MTGEPTKRGKRPRNNRKGVGVAQTLRTCLTLGVSEGMQKPRICVSAGTGLCVWWALEDLNF